MKKEKCKTCGEILPRYPTPDIKCKECLFWALVDEEKAKERA